MVKKYYKVRGRPPVLMEEDEWNKMVKSSDKPKKVKKKEKESKE